MRLRYDAISPITGKQSVLSEFDENYGAKTHLCMETGYHTYDDWFEGSEVIKLFEERAPQIVHDSKIVDSNNLCWYKTVMTTGAATIFPTEDGNWQVCKMRFLEDEEDPDSIVTLGFQTPEGISLKVVAESTSKIFGGLEFEDALFEFHHICSAIYQTEEN